MAQEKPWIDNPGDSSKRPEYDVEWIKLRNGAVMPISMFRRGVDDFYWRHDEEQKPTDIMAYR